ncbi:MAG: PIN-like domain-containing protein [Segatella copri]
MSKNKVVIGENFCFSFKSGSIGTKKEARKYFDSHKNTIDDWWIPTSKIPIFIDTNFLLNAYSLPKSQRTLFVNFIRLNKERIYITDQIDEEYQRKRPNFIKNYINFLQTIFKDLTSFQKAIDVTMHCEELVVRLENLKKRPIVQNDYNAHLESIENAIRRINEWKLATKMPCAALYRDVKTNLSQLYEQIKSEQEDILDDDDIVDVVSQCKFCGNITQTEKKFMYDLYQSCVDEREEMKMRDDHIDLQMYMFPGFRDLSKKEEHKQREGDFLHYHEMLKQINLLKKDVIFLTSDVKKGDNSTDKLEPFDHYICNCYYLTKHVYYLVDAKSLPLASQQSPVIDDDSDEDEDEENEDMANGNEAAPIANVERAKVEKKRGYFKDLTEDIFLDELSTCINWANQYGDKYVSKDYFIYGILGHKRYEFAKSRDMLQKLIADGKLQIQKNSEEKECLSIINRRNIL